MEEHGMYFAKKEFYQVVRDNGGIWNDSKERPIICLIKSVECESIYWAIPVGNYEHRDEKAKERIKKYMNYDKKDIRSCFYHVGKTNEMSIFFISDVVPFTQEYVDREYRNKSKKIHIVKNKVLLAELKYKLSRILELENRRPNYFRQHITDIKHYLIKGLEEVTTMKTEKNQVWVYNKDIDMEVCGEGIARKILAYSEDLMCVENHFETGAAGAMHHHPHTQITYVVSGKFEFTIGEEIKTVEAGDTMLQMDDIVHGCRCLEKGVILDVFTPMRKDFVE